MELYLKVCRAHFHDGLSGRQIARDFGISRDSVSKMLAYSEPPRYRRTAPIKRPKLDEFTANIDQWLFEDKTRPRKQRHTAKRVFERLRDECGFTGGNLSELPDENLPENHGVAFHPVTAPPVFVGHYKMKGKPKVETVRVACLDYPDAPCVYCWRGESDLRNSSMYRVPAI